MFFSVESILDNYSGEGDYPIPSAMQAQCMLISDQIKIILEKGLYTPAKNFIKESTRYVYIKKLAIIVLKKRW